MRTTARSVTVTIFTLVVLIMSFLTCMAAQPQVQPPGITLTIDGRLFPGKVVTTNGAHYVPIADLATYLNASVTANGNSITITTKKIVIDLTGMPPLASTSGSRTSSYKSLQGNYPTYAGTVINFTTSEYMTHSLAVCTCAGRRAKLTFMDACHDRPESIQPDSKVWMQCLRDSIDQTELEIKDMLSYRVPDNITDIYRWELYSLYADWDTFEALNDYARTRDPKYLANAETAYQSSVDYTKNCTSATKHYRELLQSDL